MKYLEYKEQRSHGTPDFPYAYYSINAHHPRYNMVYHWHTEYELVRILSGGFQMSVDGEEYHAEAGEVLFITGGALHGGLPQDCEYECLVFDLGTILRENRIHSPQARAIFQMEQTVQAHYTADMPEILSLCSELFQKIREKPEGYQWMIIGLTYCLLGTILQKKYYRPSAELPKRSRKTMQQVKKVLSYIEMEYQTDLSLDDLAEVSGLSGKYFCRLFKEIFQKTPIEYLNYYRIESACEQMAVSDRSITDIALSCGFNDISYFTKVFRKYKGMPPSHYIRQETV